MTTYAKDTWNFDEFVWFPSCVHYLSDYLYSVGNPRRNFFCLFHFQWVSIVNQILLIMLHNLWAIILLLWLRNGMKWKCWKTFTFLSAEGGRWCGCRYLFCFAYFLLPNRYLLHRSISTAKCPVCNNMIFLNCWWWFPFYSLGNGTISGRPRAPIVVCPCGVLQEIHIMLRGKLRQTTTEYRSILKPKAFHKHRDFLLKIHRSCGSFCCSLLLLLIHCLHLSTCSSSGGKRALGSSLDSNRSLSHEDRKGTVALKIYSTFCLFNMNFGHRRCYLFTLNKSTPEEIKITTVSRGGDNL